MSLNNKARPKAQFRSSVHLLLALRLLHRNNSHPYLSHIYPYRKYYKTQVCLRHVLSSGIHSLLNSNLSQLNVSGIDPPITPTPGYTIAETLGLHDFCRL